MALGEHSIVDCIIQLTLLLMHMREINESGSNIISPKKKVCTILNLRYKKYNKISENIMFYKEI